MKTKLNKIANDTNIFLNKFLYKQNNSKNSPKDPNISRLENDLSQRLAAKVSIAHQSTGRGKLQINYNSLAELEGILKRLD